VKADRRLDPAHLGWSDQAGAAASPEEGFHDLKERLISTWEREYLRRIVERAGGSMTKAARSAGVDRPYLYRLLKKHGLEA
jgi:DNA-binding NtrC family response regulator